MRTKLFYSAALILTLLVFAPSLSASNIAHRAIAVQTNETGERALAYLTSSVVTAGPPNEMVPPARAAIRHEVSWKDNFYRTSYNEPIRDFRYYAVRTDNKILPSGPEKYDAPKKYHHPLRDFRFDYWENKYYR